MAFRKIVNGSALPKGSLPSENLIPVLDSVSSINSELLGLTSGAPSNLNTLQKVAASINNDPNLWSTLFFIWTTKADLRQFATTVNSSRALSSSDTGRVILNGGPITITVQSLQPGAFVDFLQTNASQITFVPGGNQTLNSKDNNRKTSGQYSRARIQCTAANTYVLTGDLAP
jgi:hypothetical protein